MKKTLKLLVSILSIATISGCNNEKGHTHTYGNLIPMVAPTCENQGLKAHYFCEGCSAYFDEDFFEINYENLIIPMLNHEFGGYSFDGEGHYQECEHGCGERSGEGGHYSTGIMYFDDNYHWNKCECGYVMNKEEHAAMSEEYVRADGVEYHYRLCSCGQILDKAIHSFVNEIEQEEYLDQSSVICGQKPRYFKTCVCGAYGTETFESKLHPVVAHNYENTYDNENHYEECTICHDKRNVQTHTIESKVVDSGEFRGYELKKCKDCEYEYIPTLTHLTFDNYVDYLTNKGTTGANPFDLRALEAGKDIYNKLPSSEQNLVTKKDVLDEYFANYNSKYLVAYDMYQGNSKFSPENSSLYGLELGNYDDPIVGRYMNINILTDEASEPLPGSTTLDKIKQFKFNHLHKNPLTITPKSVTLAVEASYNPRFISFTSCNWVFQSGTRIPDTNWYTYTLTGADLDAFVFQYGRDNCLYRFGKYENNLWSLPQENLKLSNFVFEF